MDTTVKPVALVADAIRDLGAQWQNLLCPLDQGGRGSGCWRILTGSALRRARYASDILARSGAPWAAP